MSKTDKQKTLDRIKRITQEQCQKWIAQPGTNPITQKKIDIGENVKKDNIYSLLKKIVI